MGYGYRPSDSPLATILWWAEVEEDFTYTEAASEYWGLSFGIEADGVTAATLIGPATRPRLLSMTAGERHWGVELPPHVFLRRTGHKPLDELRPLPCDGAWFELGGVRFPVPELDGLETLLAQLAGQGVLVEEPAVAEALAGDDVPSSERNLRRQFQAAAGVRRGQISQLQRARRAYLLLQSGLTIAEAAAEAGYADQAHMTRAFRAFDGATPKQILDPGPGPFDSRPAD